MKDLAISDFGYAKDEAYLTKIFVISNLIIATINF